MYGEEKYVDPAYESYRYVDYEGHPVDPHEDPDYSTPGAKIPEEVKKFLLYFRDCINEGMIFELQNIYESMFPKLMDDHFGSDKWPVEEVVAPIVGRDPVFLTLYKELYYRNIYATAHGPSGPNLEERFRSFYNYCDLFTYILSAEQPVPLELPDQWLWELVDEFIFQFQSFSRYQSSTKISPEELTYIQSDKSVWNVINVLNILHSMIDKSNIKRQLEVYASGGDPNSVAGDFGRHSLYKMLGYFSLVGLLRLHSLLGDYYQAIKVLKNIELHKKSQYAHVPACQISTSYYVGFAYMMMRRYSDAISTFSSSLLYFQRTKQLFDSDTYQNDQINKQVMKMYKLLAMCLVLHPQCIDESLQQALKDKNLQEMMKNMERGDIKEFETCFLFSCPKFLSPTPMPDAGGVDLAEEARMHQKNVFIDEVRQQKWLPTIRSYLKLYTTLPLSKLATFMKMPIFLPKNQKEIEESEENEEENDSDEKESNKGRELIIHLLCFKHKMKNIVWTKGTSGLEGKFQSGSELDFYIDQDMIHIADTKVAHRYGVFFIGKILKFEELNRKLHMLKV